MFSDVFWGEAFVGDSFFGENSLDCSRVRHHGTVHPRTIFWTSKMYHSELHNNNNMELPSHLANGVFKIS